jgi:RsiW-degrading membrane proteinase PrsW (M82 family)
VKTASAIFIALPAVFCALLITFVEKQALAYSFLALWALSALGCLWWAYVLRQEHRRLARACVVVGCLHLALILLLPLMTPAKTRGHAGAEPARSSQQPPSFAFSEAVGDSLLLGFGRAWLPGGFG